MGGLDFWNPQKNRPLYALFQVVFGRIIGILCLSVILIARKV